MKSRKTTNYSDKAEMSKVKKTAKDVLGLKFGKILRSGSEANVVGIQSQQILFSHRLDSRTYFVNDNRYGISKEAGVFNGSDQEQLKFCRKILKQLNIPLSEIEEVMLKEKTQVAQLDRNSGEVHLEDAQEGRRIVRLLRQVNGFPVWSSNLVLGLTKDKRIGFMQLHWPEIANHVITETHRLAYKIKQGWSPPEQQDATVDAIEAGVIHSPPLGFIMDIYPVIRVIYSPVNKSVGRKPVLYLDRHGKAVPIPRQANKGKPTKKKSDGTGLKSTTGWNKGWKLELVWSRNWWLDSDKEVERIRQNLAGKQYS